MRPGAQLPTIGYEELLGWRDSTRPYALLDVRERGEYALGHLPGACPVPRGLLEVRLPRLIPWRDIPLVLYSNHTERSVLAGQTCQRLGFRDVRVLQPGVSDTTSLHGEEPIYGVNVIGKTFGEVLAQGDEVTELDADDAATLIDHHDALVLDVRSSPEHAAGHIPGAHHLPGGQLVPEAFRVGLPAQRERPVIVHCAGRTRGIIGAYLLSAAGFENVYALRNGNMGWIMSGRQLETSGRDGTAWYAATNLAASSDLAGDAEAAEFARRFALATAAQGMSATELAGLRASGHPCYVVDVRLPAEYESGHVAGATLCPAGQLANAADELVPVRNATVICVSNDQTRAQIGAALLARIGYPSVRWLEGGLVEWRRSGGAVETGRDRYLPPAEDVPGGLPRVGTDAVGPTTRGGVTVLDVRAVSEFARGHLPGSVWVSRGDLESRVGELAGTGDALVVVSDRGIRARYATATLLDLGYRRAAYLDGGLVAWRATGGESTSGLDGADGVPMNLAKQDVALGTGRPAALGLERHDMENYLAWEERLGDLFHLGPKGA